MSKKLNKEVMIIAPHMDDEVLGCGGVILKHKENGDCVRVVFVANRIYNHRFEGEKNDIQKLHALNAKGILGYDDAIFIGLHDERLDVALQDIIIPIENVIDRIRPEVVYIPFRGDNNQDHRAVYDAMRVVIRPISVNSPKTVLMYEAPSSTDQSPPLIENMFMPNYFVDITQYIEKKTKAISCYEMEKRCYPHPRSEEAIKILAQKRGIESGFRFAESFMILRMLWG